MSNHVSDSWSIIQMWWELSATLLTIFCTPHVVWHLDPISALWPRKYAVGVVNNWQQIFLKTRALSRSIESILINCNGAKSWVKTDILSKLMSQLYIRTIIYNMVLFWYPVPPSEPLFYLVHFWSYFSFLFRCDNSKTNIKPYIQICRSELFYFSTVGVSAMVQRKIMGHHIQHFPK